MGYAFLLITLVLSLAGLILNTSSREKALFGVLILPSVLLFSYFYLGNVYWSGVLFAEIPRFSYVAYPAIYLGVAFLLVKVADLGQRYRYFRPVALYVPWLIIGLIFCWNNIDIFGYPSLYYHFYFPTQHDWLLNR